MYDAKENRFIQAVEAPYFKTMTIKGDEGYFLMMGDLILQGKKLYVDFLSLNSPVTAFFYVFQNLKISMI